MVGDGLHRRPVSEVYAKSRLIAGEAERENCAFVVFVSDSRLLGYLRARWGFQRYPPGYEGYIGG